jgi:4'-phosphopantetheinyl transferase
LWLLDGSRVSGDDLDFFAHRLSASERYRYTGFARRERRRQFLLGRALLRVAAARCTGLSPDAFDVIERPGDAPRLTVPAGRCSIPYFTLSHSGGCIGCAISLNARVGLDIEVMDPTRDILAGSRIAFHREEHAWLLRQSSTTRLSAFYELWCSREALYKLDPALEAERDRAPLVRPDGTLANKGCAWHRYSLPRHGLNVIICSDRKLASIEQVELDGLTPNDWPCST